VGNDSIYAFTFKHEKNPECPVCGGETVELKVKKGTKVEAFIDILTENQKLCVLKSGSVRSRHAFIR
jgi:ubiquitin-activating enzyme E1 C